MQTGEKGKILIVIGSASPSSSNLKLMEVFRDLNESDFEISIFDDLGSLPHFDPLLTECLPVPVAKLLSDIESSNGLIICSPEYIFSIPAKLKNMLEWCVASTVFSDRAVALVTASADGQKGHEQLKLIMQTLGARLSVEAELLIPGIKGKFDSHGQLTDLAILKSLSNLAAGLKALVTIS